MLLSAFSNNGHIVRLLDVTEDGLIVDDPNGELEDGAARESQGNHYNANQENSNENLGSENLWEWSEITGEHNSNSESETFEIKYIVYFCN